MGSFASSVSDDDFVPFLEDAPTGTAFCFGYIEDTDNPADASKYAWLFHIATDDTCTAGTTKPVAQQSWLITAFGGSSSQKWITTADTTYTSSTFTGIAKLDDPATDTWICYLESDGVDDYSIGDVIFIDQALNTAATQTLVENDLRLSTVSSSTLTPFSATAGIVKTTDNDYKRGDEANGGTADPSRLPVNRTMRCGGFEVKMLNLGTLSSTNNQDVYYLVHEDLQTDTTVYPGMLRLTSTSGISGHANKVLESNSDAKKALQSLAAADLQLVVSNALGTSSVFDRTVVIKQANHPAGRTAEVRMHDILVKGGTGHAASSPGTLATSAPSSSKIGVGSSADSTTNLAPEFYYIDTAPTGVYDNTDPVYIRHPNAVGSDSGVREGDIRVSVEGFSAGTSVRNSDSDFLAHRDATRGTGFTMKLLSDRDDTRMPLKTVSTGRYIGDSSSIWDPTSDPVFITSASKMEDPMTATQVWDPGTYNSGTGAGGSVKHTVDCNTNLPQNNGADHAAWCDDEETLHSGGKLKTTGQKTTWLADGENDGDRLYWSEDGFLTLGDYRMGGSTNHISSKGRVDKDDTDVATGALFQSSGTTLFASQAASSFAHPTAGDVQIYPSFGTRWTESTSGAVARLQSASFHIARADLGETNVLHDDTYYLDFSSGSFTAGRVLRVLPYDSHSAGSFVASGDQIEIQATKQYRSTTPTDQFGYIDNAPTGLDPNDFVYMNLHEDIGGSASTTLTRWDARISAVSHGDDSFSAGTQVETGNADLLSFRDTALSGTGDAAVLWYDANLNNVVDEDDALWLRLRSGAPAAMPTFMDVRLNGSPQSGGSSGSNGGGTTTPSTTPTASFTTSMTDRTLAVDATASSATSGRSISSYEWNFGDGNTATGSTATNTYEEEGQYTVRLTVTDSSSETGTTTATVQTDGYVPPTPPDEPDDTDNETPDETGNETDPEEGGEEEDTPGPALFVLLGALGITVAVLRRRR